MTGERKPVSVSGTSDRLMATIKPLINSQLVAEFNCIYKFVVMDEVQAVHVYFLDLKHGLHTFYLLLSATFSILPVLVRTVAGEWDCAFYENSRSQQTNWQMTNETQDISSVVFCFWFSCIFSWDADRYFLTVGGKIQLHILQDKLRNDMENV